MSIHQKMISASCKLGNWIRGCWICVEYVYSLVTTRVEFGSSISDVGLNCTWCSSTLIERLMSQHYVRHSQRYHLVWVILMTCHQLPITCKSNKRCSKGLLLKSLTNHPLRLLLLGRQSILVTGDTQSPLPLIIH